MGSRRRETREATLRRVLGNPEGFSRYVIGRALRGYQLEALRAVFDSVLHGRGLTFSLMFARQMGKNEVSAHLEAFLLNLYARRGGTIVKAAPTFRPQIITSKQRLEGVLNNPLNRRRWRGDEGYMLRLGKARVLFFSGSPAASVMGATADLLLEIDEAQDFDETVYQRDFRPMASTMNATTVLYGTAWSEDDLLAQVKRANLDAEARDGVRRHFEYDWRVLAEESAGYRRFVESERERLGEDHPLFVTQYALRALAGAGRLFAPAQLAQLVGEHARLRRPCYTMGSMPGSCIGTMGSGGVEAQQAGEARYVAGLDLAGEGDGEHDQTVLTLARLVDREAAGVYQPVIEVVEHIAWRGESLAALSEQLADLLGRVWGVRCVAVDATGLGAGVASFLGAALPADVVQAVVFSGVEKSRLGYDLLSAVNGGRVRMYAEDHSVESAAFWAQARACRREPGPGQTLRFSVPAHEGNDDYVMSLALCVRAAGEGGARSESAVLPAGDVLDWESVEYV